MIVDESFIDFAGDPVPSLLADGGPVFQSAARAQHEQALRRAGPAPGILLQRQSLRAQSHAPVHSHLECEHAGAIFSVAAAVHRRGLSRRPQAPDRRRSLALRRVAGDRRNRRISHRRQFCSVQDQGRHDGRANSRRCCSNEHRMYVRDCSNKVGMDNFHIRVASQGREKDARLVERAADVAPDEAPRGSGRHPQDHPQEQVHRLRRRISSCAADAAGDSAGDGSRGGRRARVPAANTWRT